MWAGPQLGELLASLPVSGVDGTLRRSRLAPGRAHLKTGSLRDVVGIAGYVLADDGRRHVVVAIINHPHAECGAPGARGARRVGDAHAAALSRELSMSEWADWIGYAAAMLTTASFMPQAWLSFRSRDVSGISLGMYSIFTVGIALWLGYGLLLQAWPIVVANAVTLALSGSILVLKLRAGRPRR